MLVQLVAFVRLSRPVFLLGGIALFALGAGIARNQGCAIEPGAYVFGQFCVTCLQLMTHYLNEHWDFDADRINESRTKYSGGSGVLATGVLPRQTALVAGHICLAISATSAFFLIVVYDPGPLAIGVLLVAFFGAYFYSSPPLRLAARGLGEVTASFVVAGLVPALAVSLFGGRLNGSFAFVVAPLIVLHFAMLLAFDLPDERSDRIAGKRTLVVRVGFRRTALVHNGSMLAAITLALIGTLTALPIQAALPVILVGPLAVWQMCAVTAVAHGRRAADERITLFAVVIFALATALMVAVVWHASPKHDDVHDQACIELAWGTEAPPEVAL